MASDTHMSGASRGIPWRIVGWGTAALLLLLPLVAGAPWTLSDFVFAGVMFGTVGLAFELIARKSSGFAYRAGASAAIIAAFLTIWVNGAVGMIGNEDNPYNLLFVGLLPIALAGAIVARFQARGMALAMIVIAALQVAVAAGGLAADPRGGVFSIIFAGPWLISAALFWNASQERGELA